MGLGGGIDHVSPLATLTAEAMGHESLAPCFNPHLNLAWMWPLAVIMMTLLFSMLSAAHSTKPVGGACETKQARALVFQGDAAVESFLVVI